MDRAKFYAELRSSGLFGSTLSQGQVDTLEMILDEGQARGLPLLQLAYVLATTCHEVGSALEPKSENLHYSARRIRQVWPSRFASVGAAQPYADNPRRLANKVYANRLGNGPEASGDGWTYRGRGFCQVTGKANYAKFARLLGVDLVANPDRAMEPRIATLILFEGMIRGLFTGKRLSDYLGNGKGDFVGARAIVNADVGSNGVKVAGLARAFEAALGAAGYARKALTPPAMSAAERVARLSAQQDARKPVEPAASEANPRPSAQEPRPAPATGGQPRQKTWLERLVALFVWMKGA